MTTRRCGTRSSRPPGRRPSRASRAAATCGCPSGCGTSRTPPPADRRAARAADPYEEEGRSKRPLFVGVGILLAGLVAVAGVYLLKGNGDSQASNAAAPTQSTQTPSSPATAPVRAPQAPVKKLQKFKGVHTKAAGRITDARSGLSYARLSQPWALPAKKSPMTELELQREPVRRDREDRLAAPALGPADERPAHRAAKSAYDGPGSERSAATEVAKMYEERMFNFRTKKRVLASQPLTIQGHKGWLVSDYLTYRRPGLTATGDVVAVALVDTGKKTPGVLFMSVPNTSKKLLA